MAEEKDDLDTLREDIEQLVNEMNADRKAAKEAAAGPNQAEQIKESLENYINQAADETIDGANKLTAAAQDLLHKAKDAGEELFGKVQKYIDDMDAYVKAKGDPFDDVRDKRHNFEKVDDEPSMLKDKGSFFEKAAAFAEGRYDDVRNMGKEIIEKDDMKIIIDKDAKKKPSEGTAYGFEDADGDGNEIIDDADIIE